MVGKYPNLTDLNHCYLVIEFFIAIGFYFFKSVSIKLSISISKQLRCQLGYQHFGYNNRPLCIKLNDQIIGLDLDFFVFPFCIIDMFNILRLITYLDDNLVIQIAY